MSVLLPIPLSRKRAMTGLIARFVRKSHIGPATVRIEAVGVD